MDRSSSCTRIVRRRGAAREGTPSDFTGWRAGLRVSSQTFDAVVERKRIRIVPRSLSGQPTERAEFLAELQLPREQGYADRDAGAPRSAILPTILPSWLAKSRLRFGEGDAHSLELSLQRVPPRVGPSATCPTRTRSWRHHGTSSANVDRDTRSPRQPAADLWLRSLLGNDLVDLEITLSYANQEIEQEFIPGLRSTLPYGSPVRVVFPVVNADHQFETTKLTAKNTAFLTTGMISRSRASHRHRTESAANATGIDAAGARRAATGQPSGVFPR